MRYELFGSAKWATSDPLSRGGNIARAPGMPRRRRNYRNSTVDTHWAPWLQSCDFADRGFPADRPNGLRFSDHREDFAEIRLPADGREIAYQTRGCGCTFVRFCSLYSPIRSRTADGGRLMGGGNATGRTGMVGSAAVVVGFMSDSKSPIHTAQCCFSFRCRSKFQGEGMWRFKRIAEKQVAHGVRPNHPTRLGLTGGHAPSNCRPSRADLAFLESAILPLIRIYRSGRLMRRWPPSDYATPLRNPGLLPPRERLFSGQRRRFCIIIFPPGPSGYH